MFTLNWKKLYKYTPLILCSTTFLIYQSTSTTFTMSMNQKLTATSFYLHGKKYFTRTGWETASKEYNKNDILQSNSLDLSSKTFMITGANSGIGKEMTKFLAQKNATIYMICRNKERGNIAKDEIVQLSKNENVFLLIGDVGLESDIHRLISEFKEHQKQSRGIEKEEEIKLDALICNAGALLNELQYSKEGVEVTFASHFLFGTYLLGKQLLSVLKNTPESRLIAVSSGGMYNTKFPSWEAATSTGVDKYDGQLAYAYAKRGQVLLCEEWAKLHPEVKIVSCHPGWTETEGVDAAYGEMKSWLQPLRSLYQGCEGILWLAIGPWKDITSGGFYLDRKPQKKHLSGWFSSEINFTKNSPEEVSNLMKSLEEWSSVSSRPNLESLLDAKALKLPLTASEKTVDIQKFMGTWFVHANIPTFLEVDVTNCVERYDWDSKAKHPIRVTFTYFQKEKKTMDTSYMRAMLSNSPNNTQWALNFKLGLYLPFDLVYLILDADTENYDWCIIGVPDRSYLWVMTRNKPIFTDIPDDKLSEEMRLQRKEYQALVDKAIDFAVKKGYDRSKVVRVPWLSTLDPEFK